MKLPGKGTLLALLLVFLPGIAFSIFQLFYTNLPMKPRTTLFAWISLAVGAGCIIGLVVLSVRDARRRRTLRDHS